MAAVQVAGAGDRVREQWSTLSSSLPSSELDAFQQQLGLTLPDDLATLLGSRLTLSMPKQDLQALGGSDLPTIGMQSVTADPDRADEVVTKVTTALGVDNYVTHQVKDGSLYLATTPDYLRTLTSTGTLGASRRFATAVPGAGTAQAVVYVDLEALRPLLTQDASSDAKPLLESLTAAGFSATTAGDGSGTFSLRVLGG